MNVLHLTPKEDSPPFQMQLRALEERGIECTVVTVPGTADTDTSRSVVDYLRFYPRVLARSLESYDVVHANFGLTAPFALAQPQRPVVLSLWGSDLDGRFGWVSRRSAVHCDATIVMCDRMKRDLKRDCHVIPHGIDVELFEPAARKEAIDRLGWNPDAKHVLFPYKPDRTVKNYPRAKRIVDAVRDDLPYPVTLQTAVEVDHAEMPAYMNAADCLLLTSDREGSPNVVKEAVACNLPVVTLDVGDVRQQLEGITPSAVCATDRELERELASILERGVRTNGREHVDRFSMDRMAAQIVEVYRTVADGVSEPDLDPVSSPAD